MTTKLPEHAGEVRVVEGHHLCPPAKSSNMSRRLRCLASTTESKSCSSSPASALAIPVLTRLSACVADHVARVAGYHQAAGVPLVRGEGQLRREALRLHQRLIVDHDELALVRPAVPLARRTTSWQSTPGVMGWETFKELLRLLSLRPEAVQSGDAEPAAASVRCCQSRCGDPRRQP